jgi:hypothetical protein
MWQELDKEMLHLQLYTLYSIVLEKAINIKVVLNSTIFESIKLCLTYAAVIFGWSVKAIEVLTQLKSEALKSWLEANSSKAKCMKILRDFPNLGHDLDVENYNMCKSGTMSEIS